MSASSLERSSDPSDQSSSTTLNNVPSSLLSSPTPMPVCSSSGQASASSLSSVTKLPGKFEPFDSNKVTVPFDNEAKACAEDQDAFNKALLDFSVELLAWAAARPYHLTQAQGRAYEERMLHIRQTEVEQGTSSLCESLREKIVKFLENFRAAFQSFRGLGA